MSLSSLWAHLPSAVTDPRLLLVAVIALSAFMFVGGLLSIFGWLADPARRRLQTLGPAVAVPGGAWKETIAASVQRFARYVMPTSSKERGSMQEKFSKAGILSPAAMPIFYGAKSVLALLFLVLWIFASNLLPRLTMRQVLFFAALLAFVGLMIPNFILNRLIERRQRALRNAFPDALDLLVVCVESGLGLTAGLQRVAEELQVSGPELATELERVNAEMQAGMDRELALRNLATRTGLVDIRSLVGLLVQTLRFVTSIAYALRVFSDEFRDKRLQMAEELAAKLGTKMIFPMVFCFFPSFFLVAVGPAIIRVLEAFANTPVH